jgi:hypothetical protein
MKPFDESCIPNGVPKYRKMPPIPEWLGSGTRRLIPIDNLGEGRVRGEVPAGCVLIRLIHEEVGRVFIEIEEPPANASPDAPTSEHKS